VVFHKLMAEAPVSVLKDDIQEVIQGIRRVLEGGVYLSKQLDEEFA